MREIKFRQPIRDKKAKFIEWFYWGFIDGQWIQWAVQQNGLDTRQESQQFTGLLDSKGIPIYEGDIIEAKLIRMESNTINRGCIAYNERGGYWQIKYFSKRNWHLNKGLFHYHFFDVIGNIYEHPELLK